MFRQVRKHAASYSSIGYRGSSPTPPAGVEYLTFTAQQSNSSVALISLLSTAPNMEYSTDGGQTWSDWPYTTVEGVYSFNIITLGSVGDAVKLRGINPGGFVSDDGEQYSAFTMSGKIAASGNAQTIVDGDNPTLTAKPMPCFSSDETSDVLTQAPALPATTLAEYCYDGMFYGCTGLTQAPALPATTLATECYFHMFYGCTGLTQAPALPATTLATECYSYMFYGCTGLTQAPALPATTLARNCYSSMFLGCTSLTAAPALPATTLAIGCYYDMFEHCLFAMSSDGSTFNFNCAATLPQTIGGTTYSTPYNLAEWMGNTNGFTN